MNSSISTPINNPNNNSSSTPIIVVKKSTYSSSLYQEENRATFWEKGSLAPKLVPRNSSGIVNILDDYSWTLTPRNIMRTQTPKIILKEFATNESLLLRQILFYAQQILKSVQANLSAKLDLLNVYGEMFPKDGYETKWKYVMPYLSESNLELRTNDWASMGAISDMLAGLADTQQQTNNAAPPNKLLEFTKFMQEKVLPLSNTLGASIFPYFGINDRPRIFTGHSHRTINVSFPLFNTAHPSDWQKNRDFLFLFMNQNLLNKRDFITALPPVYYEVFIPGQYYSVASYVSNFSVTNRGNLRTMYYPDGRHAVIPDVFQVNISLTEFTMPSQNQFQAIDNGDAKRSIEVGIKTDITKIRESAIELIESGLMQFSNGIATFQQKLNELLNSNQNNNNENVKNSTSFSEETLQPLYNTGYNSGSHTMTLFNQQKPLNKYPFEASSDLEKLSTKSRPLIIEGISPLNNQPK